MAALSVDGTPMPALPNSADQINYDNTTSGLSATTVKGAVDELASEKQDATDNNLTTTNKTIVGGINELKSGLTNVDVALSVPNGTGKNLFNSTLNSYSVNGVTITNNNDGTYRLSGTATSTVWGGPIGSVKLKAGTYKLVGWNPNTPGIQNAVMIYIYDHTSINDYGQGGTTFTLEEETTYSVNFVINNGTTIDTVIKPMITEDINATYSDFVPYIPSVESRIEAVESGLNNLNKHLVLDIPANTYSDYGTALLHLNNAYLQLNTDQKKTAYILFDGDGIARNVSITGGYFPMTNLGYGTGWYLHTMLFSLAHQKYFDTQEDGTLSELTGSAQSMALALYY